MTNSREEGDNLVLEYDLFDLPTAQHKAGLGGLLLLARSMKERGLWQGPDPFVTSTTVKWTLSKDTLQAIFDDLYDARWIEKEWSSKWQGKEPKRIVTKEITAHGKVKTEKRYVYDAVQPKGEFLQTYYPDGDGLWMRLWRDMTWNTLRSRPTTRNVYQERADGKDSSSGPEWWRVLHDSARDRQNGKLRSEEYGSAIFLGAQGKSAEKVPFRGVTEEIFLLYFWPVAAGVYAPKGLDIERDRDRGLVVTREDAGFVVVVPEPANLKYFVDDTIETLRSFEVTAAGYRPAEAVIDAPAEGGMEYLYHLARARASAGEVADTLAAVELYHLEKRDKNVRMLKAERLAPKPATIALYDSLRTKWANPIFKTIGLKNLLAGTTWHSGCDEAFSVYPWQFFIYIAKETPKEIRFFGQDVRRRMQALESTSRIPTRGGVMGEEELAKKLADQLAVRVYHLVENFVNRKTEEKSGKSYKNFMKEKGEDGKTRILYPNEYREAREKICSDAFLGIRGRRDKEFVEYFIGTVCSVPHFLPENEYVAVSQALMGDWESVKTLAMLALSAVSYLSGSSSNTQEVTS